jgi:FkbM family methyltransferase
MKLSEIKTKYGKGLIAKHDFIDEMYSVHTQLFEYMGQLGADGISKIEISPSSVVMSMKSFSGNGEIKLNCVTNDKRTTVLEVLNFGKYEEDDASMLFSMTEKDFTVLDIGANIGWYSLNFSKILTAGEVYSFEPIPDTYSNLQSNILLNKAANIKSFNLALSNVNGETEFFYNPDELGAASARNIKDLNDIKKVKCKTQTIDSFVTEKKINKLDLIKCDVEGGELFVFEGGKNTFTEFKPVIFTEMLRKWSAKFNYHPNKIIEFFSGFGYNCFIVNNGKLKPVNEVKEDTVETNFIFLHAGKHQEMIKKYS